MVTEGNPEIHAPWPPAGVIGAHGGNPRSLATGGVAGASEDLEMGGPWLRMSRDSVEERKNKRVRFLIFFLFHVIDMWHFVIGAQKSHVSL